MTDILYKDSLPLEEQREELTKLTYDQFMEFKDNWLKNIHMTWLIQGHLLEEDALKMVRVAEEAIDFNRIEEAEVILPRCMKLNPGTIYNFESKNVLAKSANSCTNVIH